MRKIPTLVLSLAAAAFILAPASQADIVLDTAFPTMKQPTRVHVTDDGGTPVQGAEVTVTYRPGSAVETRSVVGHTGRDGTLTWTPAEAGIVTITAGWTGAEQAERSDSINSSVKFDQTPIAGILIMIIAGVVLIGGSLERIWSLLSEPDAN